LHYLMLDQVRTELQVIINHQAANNCNNLNNILADPNIQHQIMQVLKFKPHPASFHPKHRLLQSFRQISQKQLVELPHFHLRTNTKVMFNRITQLKLTIIHMVILNRIISHNLKLTHNIIIVLLMPNHRSIILKYLFKSILQLRM